MSNAAGNKRKRPNGSQKTMALPPKKSKRRVTYHSSSEEEDAEEENATEFQAEDDELSDKSISSTEGGTADAGVTPPQLLEQPETKAGPKNTDFSVDNVEDDESKPSDEESSEADSDSGSEEGSPLSTSGDEEDLDGGVKRAVARKPRKRNDPTQFATSISKILSTKLTKDKRSDPVLSRSKEAADFSKELAESRLEAKAKKKLREEKKAALDKGREEDVLGLNRDDTSAGAVAEEEKQLKKTAQRGVVKLFNAVRAAQVKGEEAARAKQAGGLVGVDKRKEHVNEMSKKGFLDLLVDGGS